MDSCLLIDTALIGLSVGLMRGDSTASGFRLIANEYIVDKLASDKCLAQFVDEFLQKNSENLENINCIGVSVGPGSFTGIKIGIALAQGLRAGSSSRIKLIGVSSLQFLNYQDAQQKVWALPATSDQGYLAASVDGNCQLYIIKEKDGKIIINTTDGKIIPLNKISDTKEIYLIGNWQRMADHLNAQGLNPIVCDPQALIQRSMEKMCMVVGERIHSNRFDDDLMPLYLRKSTPEEKLTL